MKKASQAFTLIEIMIVIAIIGIVIAIAIPAFLRARENSFGRACQENLAKVDGAKQQYAMEEKVPEGSTIPDDALWAEDKTGYLKAEPTCPQTDDPYTIGEVGTDPTCPNYNEDSEFVKHEVVGTL